METGDMIPTTSAEEQITEITNEIPPSPATAGNEPTVLQLRGGSDTSSDVSYGISKEYNLTEDTSLSYLMDALANEESKNVESAAAFILNYQELYVKNNPDYPKWTMEELKETNPLMRQTFLHQLQHIIELDKGEYIDTFRFSMPETFSFLVDPPIPF